MAGLVPAIDVGLTERSELGAALSWGHPVVSGYAQPFGPFDDADGRDGLHGR
jgi:hypothetical protein